MTSGTDTRLYGWGRSQGYILGGGYIVEGGMVNAKQAAVQRVRSLRDRYASFFRVQGAGCRVQGAGCRVQGAGCRV